MGWTSETSVPQDFERFPGDAERVLDLTTDGGFDLDLDPERDGAGDGTRELTREGVSEQDFRERLGLEAA